MGKKVNSGVDTFAEKNSGEKSIKMHNNSEIPPTLALNRECFCWMNHHDCVEGRLRVEGISTFGPITICNNNYILLLNPRQEEKSATGLSGTVSLNEVQRM